MGVCVSSPAPADYPDARRTSATAPAVAGSTPAAAATTTTPTPTRQDTLLTRQQSRQMEPGVATLSTTRATASHRQGSQRALLIGQNHQNNHNNNNPNPSHANTTTHRQHIPPIHPSHSGRPNTPPLHGVGTNGPSAGPARSGSQTPPLPPIPNIHSNANNNGRRPPALQNPPTPDVSTAQMHLQQQQQLQARQLREEVISSASTSTNTSNQRSNPHLLPLPLPLPTSAGSSNGMDEDNRARTAGGSRLSLPFTPNGKEKEIYKFFCPICFQYFKEINKSSCCNNYICTSCALAHIKQRLEGTSNWNMVPSTFLSVSCPSCGSEPVKFVSVSSEEKIRSYQESPNTRQALENAEKRRTWVADSSANGNNNNENNNNDDLLNRMKSPSSHATAQENVFEKAIENALEQQQSKPLSSSMDSSNLTSPQQVQPSSRADSESFQPSSSQPFLARLQDASVSPKQSSQTLPSSSISSAISSTSSSSSSHSSATSPHAHPSSQLPPRPSSAGHAHSSPSLTQSAISIPRAPDSARLHQEETQTSIQTAPPLLPKSSMEVHVNDQPISQQQTQGPVQSQQSFPHSHVSINTSNSSSQQTSNLSSPLFSPSNRNGQLMDRTSESKEEKHLNPAALTDDITQSSFDASTFSTSIDDQHIAHALHTSNSLSSPNHNNANSNHQTATLPGQVSSLRMSSPSTNKMSSAFPLTTAPSRRVEEESIDFSVSTDLLASPNMSHNSSQTVVA